MLLIHQKYFEINEDPQNFKIFQQNQIEIHQHNQEKSST